MPELPEVETIKRGLDNLIVGQTIKSVSCDWPKTFPGLEAGKSRVEGRQIKGLQRRGKVLILNLSSSALPTDQYSLMLHLKMTGQLVYVKASGERFAGGHPTESMERQLPDRSTRAVFVFQGGDRLFFNDQRKFGWIKLTKTTDIELDPLVARLGPEPLSPDFTLERLASGVKRHGRAPIKAIILDQSSVAGLGNIYVDEALNLARIYPGRLGCSLKPGEIKRLHTAIGGIIQQGINHGGTSFTHYVNALGQRGDYLERARVFRRQGQPCHQCGTIIEKIRLAGRGTHFCPRCQRGSSK